MEGSVVFSLLAAGTGDRVGVDAADVGSDGLGMDVGCDVNVGCNSSTDGGSAFLLVTMMTELGEYFTSPGHTSVNAPQTIEVLFSFPSLGSVSVE